MIEYRGFRIYATSASNRGKGKEGTYCGEIPNLDGKIVCHSGSRSLEEAYQRGKDLVDQFLREQEPFCQFCYQRSAEAMRAIQVRLHPDKAQGKDW